MYYETKDNRLSVGEYLASDLAREYGTPLFVTDQQRLEENFKRISEAYNKRTQTRVFFACKALTNIAVLKVLRTLGAYIDAVSPGEVEAALRAGYPQDRIMFTGPNPSDADLDQIVDSGVMINLDSLSALRRVKERLDGQTIAGLSFRVNPEVGAGHHDHCVTGAKVSKFGIPQDRIVEAYKEAIDMGLGELIKGVHCHIGSGILETEPFFMAVDSMIEITKKIEEGTGLTLEFVDIGGGYGIPYRPEEKELDVDDVAEQIVKRFKAVHPDKVLCVEPGRYLSADCTQLLTTVNTIKETQVKTYVGIDAGFNTLPRHILYGSYHHVVHTDNVNGQGDKVDIAGPLCESGDIFHKDYPLPPVKEGDVLAFQDAGGYGFTMSSNYNSRPLAAELLVNGDKKSLMRKHQPLEDLFKNQVLPEWL